MSRLLRHCSLVQIYQMCRSLLGWGVSVQFAGERVLHNERWRAHNLHSAADVPAGDPEETKHAEADHHWRRGLSSAAAGGAFPCALLASCTPGLM